MFKCLLAHSHEFADNWINKGIGGLKRELEWTAVELLEN